jgi:hypothetical protein
MGKSKFDRQPSEHTEDDDTKYSPSKIVFPAMAAIWLAFFVVALVSTA